MKILGFTDSKTECDCGKQGLKGVYVVETEQGETLYLGSSCVKKNWDLSQKEFTSKVNEAKEEIRKAKHEYLKPFNAAFNAVADKYPNTNKYTPEAGGYTEFMKVMKELKAAQESADEKYKF